MERITERHPVPSPMVYGYLRVTTTQSARRQAFTRALESYCRPHKFQLGGTFTDNGESSVMSPAFAGLLAVLVMDRSHAVVIPARSHLGVLGIGVERTDLIVQTGRRLIVLCDGRTKANAVWD